MNRHKMHTSSFAWLPYHQPFLTIEGEGGDGGSGVDTSAAGGDGGAGNGNATPPSPNWADFTASLEGLNHSLGGKLDDLVSTVRTASEPPPTSHEPVDLESMSRPELVAHIVGTVTQAIESKLSEALGPVTNQLNSLQTSVVTRDAQSEINTLKSAHKDFSDWKQELPDLARAHPTLSITQLYRLARAENPDKASTLDKKYAPPAPPPVRPRFGGLLPTGSAAGNGAKPISGRDAVVEAYREVQARHPDVLAALDNM